MYWKLNDITKSRVRELEAEVASLTAAVHHKSEELLRCQKSFDRTIDREDAMRKELTELRARHAALVEALSKERRAHGSHSASRRPGIQQPCSVGSSRAGEDNEQITE
jgi:chromosome segregation ATPase